MVAGIACDVSRAEPDVLVACRRLALRTTAGLLVFSSPEARPSKAVQLRENLAQYDAMSRATMQRIYELTNSRHMQVEKHARANMAKVAKLYIDLHMKEPITSSFVDTTITTTAESCSLRPRSCSCGLTPNRRPRTPSAR